jgi:DNA-binding CsgD family transcriptional regulator
VRIVLLHLARALRLAHRFDQLPPCRPGEQAEAGPEPTLVSWPEATRLRLLYRFTPTETEVANLVLAGLVSEAIATRLGVSVNTVRTHLRNMYEKTNTRRQPELMARLVQGPAQMAQRGRGLI